MNKSNWIKQSFDELKDLAKLPKNWDSYGANPILTSVLLKATFLLVSIDPFKDYPKPFIVPVASGGIDIEWCSDYKLLSIKIRDNEIRYVIFDRHIPINRHGRTEPIAVIEKGKLNDIEEINELIDLWIRVHDEPHKNNS